LVLARLLFLQNYNVQVFIEKDSNRSTENKIQLERLKNLVEIKISEIEHNQLPDFQKFTVLIDCIFGTGLTRSLDGFWKSEVNAINQAKIEIIAIDLPSGLFAEPEITFKPNLENTIKAKITLAIQATKTFDAFGRLG
jgi:NAD(P)H-hydrate repair Nnr-like enzyme with NAD(P)H-hydrate epimerase domain